MNQFRCLAVVTTLFIAAESSGQIAHAQPGLAAESEFSQRELKASPHIRDLLVGLREEATTKEWTFEMGYTGALDIPLERLAGTRPPENLIEQAQLQNRKVQQSLLQPQQNRQEKQRFEPEEAACNTSVEKWDWRTSDDVTPIRHQLACGSCWAFTTLGAFEGSWSMGNGQHIDASEQAVLNCSGAGSCAGGWWAFDYLVSDRVPTEPGYPYTADDRPCESAIPPMYGATIWGYVSATSIIPTVIELKQALCEHGPLAVAVCATPAFQAYTGGVFNENAPGQVNHGVTLIGWDDSKEAWLIKNSWGTSWGDTCGFGTERGYMWIKYGTNKIGHGAAWVTAGSAQTPFKVSGQASIDDRQGAVRRTVDRDVEQPTVVHDEHDEHEADGHTVRYYTLQVDSNGSGVVGANGALRWMVADPHKQARSPSVRLLSGNEAVVVVNCRTTPTSLSGRKTCGDEEIHTLPDGYVFVENEAHTEWHSDIGSSNWVNINFEDRVEVIPGTGITQARTMRVHAHARSGSGLGERGHTHATVRCRFVRFVQ